MVKFAWRPEGASKLLRNTMFCPKCGSNQREGQRFCATCGTNLHPAPQFPPGQMTPQNYAQPAPQFPPQNYAQPAPQFPPGQFPPQNYAQPARPPRLDDATRTAVRVHGIILCVFGVFLIALGLFSAFFIGAGSLCLIIAGLIPLGFGILRLVIF
jgi:hypothetical protein